MTAELSAGQKAAATRAAKKAAGRRYVVGPMPLPRAREDRPILPTACSVFAHVKQTMAGADREMFRVLCLDSRSRLLADVICSVGSSDSCQVDPREVFAPAVVARASAVILCHNHPSGNPDPSMADIQLTSQLRKAGETLCIRVLDHVVVTDTEFVSMQTRLMME